MVFNPLTKMEVYQDVYPEWWNDNEMIVLSKERGFVGFSAQSKIQPLVTIIGGCEDDTFRTIAKNKDAKEISLAEAKTLQERWRPRRLEVRDIEKVVIILAKAVKGEPLTLEDRQALDPEHETAGIHWREEFDIINYYHKRQQEIKYGNDIKNNRGIRPLATTGD